MTLSWVGYVVVVSNGVPKLFLHRLWSIGVPDFQTITVGSKILLGIGQTLRNAESNHGWHAGRIERSMGRIIGPCIAQFDENCRVNAFNVYEGAVRNLGRLLTERRNG